MNYAKDLIKYIEDSPSGYHAVQNALAEIKKKENYSRGKLKPGRCFAFTKETKDGAALAALDIGENAAEYGWPVHIIAAHVDSPWFLVKGDRFIKSENTLQMDVKPYGGILQQTWMDRPLTLAGRVELKTGKTKLFHLKDKTFVIPGMCSHFKKYLEEGASVHPLYGSAGEGITSVRQLLAKELNIKEKDIAGWTVNTVCKEKALIWGDKNEYISSGRLDDLACVYAGLKAFTGCHNPNAINVLYLCDNEEIGSKTSVGAFGNFFKGVLSDAAKQLGFSLSKAMKNSYMISADNAQGCHPDHPYVYNPKHKIYMNKGLSTKVSERYSTTEESLEIFDAMCQKAKKPHQLYYNREDIRGGGTIGKIVQDKLKVMSVDVGIPQLAMHSCYETMGTEDIKTTVGIFRYFYSRFSRSVH